MFISPSDTKFIFFVIMAYTNDPDSFRQNDIGLSWNSATKLDYHDTNLENYLSGSGYAELVNSNPWSNLDYKQTGWQKFLGALGFRTGYDKAVENQQFQSKEYLANVAAMKFQNDYNSPSNMAARMRAAGLNPDLQGLGDVSESASLAEDTNNTLPNGDGSETLDILSKGVNFIMSGISMAVGFAKDLGALKQISIANETGQIGNAQGLMELAIDAVLNHNQKEMVVRTDPLKEEGDDLTPSIRETPAWVVDYKTGLSRKQYRQFKKFVDDFWNDSARIDTARNKDWIERMESRKSAFRHYTDPNYSDQDDVLLGLSKIFSKYSGRIEEKTLQVEEKTLDTESSELNARAAHARNASAYENALDPEMAAVAENATNENVAQNAKLDTDLNSMMSEVMKLLHDKADHGSKFASIALICFSVMRMMSASYKSGSKGGYSIGIN